jgi:bacillolysin
MPKFRSINFNAQREAVASAVPEMLRTPSQLHGLLRTPTGEAAAAIGRDETLESRGSEIIESWSVETAARSHLQTLLENQNSERLAEITSPDRPELVPDMRMEASREQPLTGTHTVTFQQTSKSIPIFGTRATVELDGLTRKLVSVDGMVTDVPDVSAVATVSPEKAAAALASFGDGRIEDIQKGEAPLLNFFLDERVDGGRWRLVYVFRKVPQTPAIGARDIAAALHCCGPTLPSSRLEYDYLVDANNSEVVFYYSSYAHLDVPVPCQGSDTDGVVRNFYGLPVGQAGVHLSDPLRNMATYDHGFADISIGTAFPAAPVRSANANFAFTAPAAVSAHYHATRVFDFFNHVLKRNGVDDKGMKLESVVNCYSSADNPDRAPVWRNAAWWRDRMWYGQMPNGAGGYTSTARFLDVIGHELTHGVTEYTAGLVYQGQSGALNESYSDIFGVIIQNWYPGEPNPISAWIWDIGANWSGHGTVLRSLQDPTLGGQPLWPVGRGQPAHMNQYVITAADDGGVHANSGIHNKAAHLVLTATDAAGGLVFEPQEVAILYYLTLTRLGSLAKFSDCRRVLLNVATTYFSYNAVVQQQKLQAITQAYAAVGIV